MPERVLHMALRTPQEGQPALARALSSIGEYDEIDWDASGIGAFETALANANRLRPTLIFAQIQRAGAFTPQQISELKAASDPACVACHWDGDMHHRPAEPARAWFVELGKVFDTSLVCTTAHLAEYAAMGVNNPGYLQIGIDKTLYRPTEPTPGTPPIVMLASRYATHERRNRIVEQLAERYGDQFAVYGHGWSGSCARPMLRQDQEAGVYAAAKCAISMSIRNDLPCYTSDRLFRAMGSGAVVLAELFPGMVETLGLNPGVDCLAWFSTETLFRGIEFARSVPEEIGRWMRARASHLVHVRHTWQARMPELLEIVRAVREKEIRQV